MISNISAFAQSREYGKGVIHMVQGKVEICGVNTSKLPVVKSTQQDQFFERIKQGDEQARQEYLDRRGVPQSYRWTTSPWEL